MADTVLLRFCLTESTFILSRIVCEFIFKKRLSQIKYFLFRPECTPNKENYTDWPVDVSVGYRDIVEKLHFLLDDHKLRVREKFKDKI